MNNLAFASIKELKNKLFKKEISHEELLKFFLNRFEKYDSKINSALEVFDYDSILSVSNKNGSLYGIPGIIKDNICQKNRKLTCASKILENYISPYDATASSRFKDDGAFLIGRANMDEFAMGSSTETSYFKKTCNPWNLKAVPGGSSGGSAAAVAAGLVPWALGSETGGSVRQPAAFCGLFGLKPTYGLISRYGLVAYASSLDQIGIFTRSVYDNALILSSIAGKDNNDSTSLNVDPKNYTAQIDEFTKADKNTPLKNITLGIIDNALEAEGIEPEAYNLLNKAIKTFEKLGAKIKRIKLPMMDYAAATYFVISRAEAASNLSRFDGVKYGFRAKADSLNDMYINTREEGFGFEVKSRILVGNYVLSAGHAEEFYTNAKITQSHLRNEFIEAFEQIDLLFSPVTPGKAFEFERFSTNKLLMDLQDYFTCSVNLAGIPSLSIPCGLTTDNMPIGFQLIGPDLSEALIYQVAYAYEQNLTDNGLNNFIPAGFE